MAGGCKVVKKFQFLEKILHSKSPRMINGGSGIAKAASRSCLEGKLLRGVTLRRPWDSLGGTVDRTQGRAGRGVLSARGET